MTPRWRSSTSPELGFSAVTKVFDGYFGVKSVQSAICCMIVTQTRRNKDLIKASYGTVIFINFLQGQIFRQLGPRLESSQRALFNFRSRGGQRGDCYLRVHDIESGRPLRC